MFVLLLVYMVHGETRQRFTEYASGFSTLKECVEFALLPETQALAPAIADANGWDSAAFGCAMEGKQGEIEA